jgi:hypothetical protein
LKIKLKDFPADVKLSSTTWAKKKKVNSKYRARITPRDFLQEDGVYYFSHSTTASVATELTMKIILTFFLTTWKAQVIDVKGAFLKERFVDGENLYLHIPQGFEKFYEKMNNCT